MAYMRSTLAFALFWINLIVASLNIYFSIEAYNYNRYYLKSYNLRGTKEKLLKINPDYFLEKEIETPKELRNLAVDTRRLLLFIDIGAFVFLMLLVASFCLTENECCSNDENIRTNFAMGSCYGTCVCCSDCNCRGADCNCSGGGDCGQAGLAILILVVIIIVFVAIYFAVKACGKHVARIFAIVFLFFINGTLTGMAFYSGTDKFCVLVGVFSLFAAICDLLGIIIPNCSEKLTYDYRYPTNPENPINSNPQVLLVEQPMVNPVQPVVVQPQFEKPTKEDYPEMQEVSQVPYDKPVENAPIYTNQTQGYDSNAYNAPAPIYQNQNQNYNTNNDNNMGMGMDNQQYPAYPTP